MSAALITRRALVAGTGAALGAATVPAGISAALSARTPPTGLPTAAPHAFDAAAYVADLRAAGFSVAAVEAGDRPMYDIGVGLSGVFGGRHYREVMVRWSDAIDACPDHAARVIEHLFEQVARCSG